MKTISPAFQAHLSQPYQTTCTCWIVTQVSGDDFYYTDHDQNLTLPAAYFPIGGGETFLAAVGYTPSSIVTSETFDVGNMEVQGILTAPSITENSLRQGLWDGAAVNIFLVNWADLTMGPVYLVPGNIGKVNILRGAFKAELRDLRQAYSRGIGELCAPDCRANLGDSRCQVPLTVPLWSALTPYTEITVGDASLGSQVAPLTPNGYWFICTTAGTTGSSEPAWTLTPDGTTNDGSVVWTTIYARTVESTITGVNPDGTTLYDSSLTVFPGPTGTVAITGISNANPGVVTTLTPIPDLANGDLVVIANVGGMVLLNTNTIAYNPSGSTFELGIDTSNTAIYGTYTPSTGTVCPFGADSGYFDFGVMTMTSGQNEGLSMEVKSFVPGQITLQLPFGGGLYPVEIGDTYSMHAGCDKKLPTCRDRFRNIFNKRSEDYVPGLDQLMQIGNPGKS